MKKKPTNDVFSPDFKSKMDVHFTSAVKEDKWGQYSSWDKDAARSALSTKRPIKASKYWSQGILGVKSPVARN